MATWADAMNTWQRGIPFQAAPGQAYAGWSFNPYSGSFYTPEGSALGSNKQFSYGQLPAWAQQGVTTNLRNMGYAPQQQTQQANPWASWGQQFGQTQPYNPYQQQGFGGYGGYGGGYQAQQYRPPQNPWANWGQQLRQTQPYQQQGFGFNQNYGGW